MDKLYSLLLLFKMGMYSQRRATTNCSRTIHFLNASYIYISLSSVSRRPLFKNKKVVPVVYSHAQRTLQKGGDHMRRAPRLGAHGVQITRSLSNCSGVTGPTNGLPFFAVPHPLARAFPHALNAETGRNMSHIRTTSPVRRISTSVNEACAFSGKRLLSV